MRRVVSWDSAQNGELTLSTIHLSHQPSSRFRISAHSCPKRTLFPGVSIAGRLYVLRGACSYRIGDMEWQVHAPAYLDFPEGEFFFSAETDVDIVQVWELPRVC